MKLHAAAIGLLSIALSGVNAKQGSLRDQNERALKKKKKTGGNNARGNVEVATTNVEEPVECSLRTVEPLMLNPEDEGFVKHVCVMDSANEDNIAGIAYEINVDGFDPGVFEGLRFDGTDRLSISSANVEIKGRHGGGTIKGPTPQGIVTMGKLPRNRAESKNGAEKGKKAEKTVKNRRDLSQKTGTSTLLVLYAIPLDVENGKSSSEYSDDIFGTDGDQVNVRSQASACSRGQLEYVPAESDLFINGVLEVPIDENVAGVEDSTVVNWVTAAAQVLLTGSGVSLFDFTQIMHIIPSEANWGQAAAWAYLPGSVSAFRDTYADRMGVQLHEFGHNLGLHHSGNGSQSYADHSCLMGNPSWGDDGPQICWNAAKSWESTWYEEDSVTVTPSESGDSIELVGVADWVTNVYTSGTHRVVLQILDSSIANGLDYYVIYNRAKGPNAGVTFAKDQVTISTGAAQEISWHQAGLAAGELFRKAGYNGSTKDLVVKVCEMSTGTNVTPDSARVLIYLDDGPDADNGPSCDGTTPPPSPSAPTTPPPTPGPTNFPTNAPTPAPTAFACDSANHVIEVDITTDSWPAEISWELFATCSGSEVLLNSNSGLGYTSNSAQPTDKTCAAPGRYLFRIKDSWGDGITSTGGYQIKMDGLVEFPLTQRGQYDEQEQEFGQCTTPPPTPSPTYGTTPPPTPSPTSGTTPPPTPSPASGTTPPPTPSATGSNSPHSGTTPSPTGSNSPDSGTTPSPTFLSCSQHDHVACEEEPDCQWLGTCHNCGCVLQGEEEEEDSAEEEEEEDSAEEEEEEDSAEEEEEEEVQGD